VPDIGGDEVEVTEIMVKVGDTVAAEQSLITVEGDKASMEVPAPFAGTVKEIKINTGDKVSTGSLIMIFEVAGAAPAAAPAQAAALRLLHQQLLARKTLTYRTSAVMKLK
jgi:pyruvate dehydrogenase E2 component (dihydrolipoamide acetyltransferase)